MNCAEARRLLDAGARPGSATPERARLGFHLAGCAACRAYLATLEDDVLEGLLSRREVEAPAAPLATNSLANPAGAPPVSLAALEPEPEPPPVPKAPVPARPRQSLFRRARYAIFAAVALVTLLAVSVFGSAAWSIFQIHRNVQAMIVATSTATLQPPTLAPPTSTPRPTSTPQSTSTPRPTEPPPTPTPAGPPAGGPVTVLLLGSDRRPGEAGAPRTDAIIVARIDPERGRVALLSLPRDLWVEIPGYGAARINAAHVWGIIYNDPEGGMGLARRTVGNLLGIPIDYTMMIDFAGFIGAIDALGGVDVDVTKELYDDAFPTMDYGYTVAHFLPGRQRMDGATALMYSRIRHPDSDFERMRRQQAVLGGVLGRLREQDAAASLKSLEAVTAALRGFVQTDIPEDRLIGLAWALRDFAPERIERYVLDENMVSLGIGADQYAEVAQPGAVESLAQQLLGPQ
jgi:LCP family protein required for cell wall assembly